MTMKSAITASLVPEALKGPFVFHQGLEHAFDNAARLGFDAVEIFPRGVDSFSVADVSALCRQYGISIAAVGTGAGAVVHGLSLADHDKSVREKAVDFIHRIIDIAGELSAPAILGSMQGKVHDESDREKVMGWLADSIRGFGERAQSGNVPFLIEPLNRYESNIFNRVADTADWIRSNQCNNVRVLADLFHMNIEESDIAKAISNAGELVGHVHFADSNRQAVGFGHTSLEAAVHALREIGYTGYLSAEVFALPDSLAAAQQTIDSFQKLTQ